MAYSEILKLNTEAILREELTDAEVRELLRRLSVEQFQGSEHPTVAAVCEACGVGPEVVGRMLAEIRQENLKELFGVRLDTHEQKIVKVEQEVKQLRKRPFLRPAIAPEVLAEMEDMAQQRIMGRKHQETIFVILAFVLLACFCGLAGVFRSNKSQNSSAFESSYVHTARSGRVIHYNPNGGKVWAEGPNGEELTPTDAEMDEIFPLNQINAR
jgi:hypothetical protein